jgi:hypothetical protein
MRLLLKAAGASLRDPRESTNTSGGGDIMTRRPPLRARRLHGRGDTDF